ncbi:unnamed protein product, partial [Hydatigera taeniaeformis]|uniref:Vacuolar protein sorting-associated protein 54 n=1 Tax=Hydatigena taeniaeformis TaxID=6205 RepID=A0A0R3WPL3_HYDTA
NPFALAQTPEPLGTVDTTISEFFNKKSENAYENESLIKPTEGDSPLATSANHEDFKSSHSDLVSTRRTLPTNEAQFYFKLLSETLMLRKLVGGMQRSPSQLFLVKLAPFQIIQLCDCVRKLSSVEPHTEDGKLIKKLSIEANRHQKFKVKAKTVARLRNFYQRVYHPVLQSSISKMSRIMEEEVNATLKNAEVHLNGENTFNLTGICSAILFDTTDSLSLFFLESIKQRCITTSGNAVLLSTTEYQKLSTLAQEAIVMLKAVQSHLLPPDTHTDIVFQLLCLYKIRALIRMENNFKALMLGKRLLWKHALTQFFNCYPEKASKSLFTNAAFNIFVEESDHLCEDIQSGVLEEVQVLIEGIEKTTNATPEAVANLLSSKTKCHKVLEAVQSKYVVSSVNNRQINCDPCLVGQWMSTLASCSNDSLLAFLESARMEEVQQFLLTRPETQELNESAPTEHLVISNSVDNMATFEPTELTRLTSTTAGIGQSTSKSNLIFILLLETLIKQCNQSKIFINRSVFAELQGLSIDTVVKEAESGTVDDVEGEMNATDEGTTMEQAEMYLTLLLLNDKTFCTPSQYDVAVKLLHDIKSTSSLSVEAFDTLKNDVDEFGARINSFLNSDSALLCAIVSLRALRSQLVDGSVQPTDHRHHHMQLLFVLSISRAFISAESPLHEAVTTQMQKFRVSLVEEVDVEGDANMLQQLQTFLEEELINALLTTTSGCSSQLSTHGCVKDLNFLSSLQFLCVAISLLPVDIEVKLLAILLCRPACSMSVEGGSLIQALLGEVNTKLQTSTPLRSRRSLRLTIPLLPVVLNLEGDQSSVEFDKLLTTLFIANDLAEEMKTFANFTLNNLISKVVWKFFFNHEPLTLHGLFDELGEKTSKLTSEWLRTDRQQCAFFPRLFYTAGGLPLGQLRSEQLPVEGNFSLCQMESYFILLQSLLVITTIVGHTDPNVMLSKDHLVALYHAAVLALHSVHLHGRHEAKVGLIWLLHRIESLYPPEGSDEVVLHSLLPDNLLLRDMLQSAVSKAGRSVVESLRSRIAPIILPLGSESGDPFMSPDPELVKEGLKASLCGYFSISPSDALSALRILRELQYKELSSVDLALTCRIINYLFKDDCSRFKNSNRRDNACVVDLPDDSVQSTAIEIAMSNLEAFASIGSLDSSQDVEIFLKSIFTLSSCIGMEYFSEQAISETIISSPSETFSSFSARPSSGTDVFHSPQSSPMLLKASKEPSPDDEHTLRPVIQFNAKVLLEGIDQRPEESTIVNLLDVYHHSRLLLQAHKSIDTSSAAISKLLPETKSLLPSHGHFLTEFQAKCLDELSQECRCRLFKRFEEIFSTKRIELSLRLLHGYFSLQFPTATKTPIAAQELLSLRLAAIQRTLTQNELWSYVEKTLGMDSTLSNNESLVLAIQGAEKALEGFSLNTVEQICLLYSIHQEDGLLFADLGAAISWMEMWPVQLSDRQRQCLQIEVHNWTKLLSKSVDLSNMRCLDACEVYRWISVGLFVDYSQRDCLKAIDSHPEGTKDPKLCWLRESIEPPLHEVDEIVDFLEAQLSTRTLDEFATLDCQKVLQIIGCLRQLTDSTDLFNASKEIVAKTCQRLYLANACTSTTEAKEDHIELPRKYLRLQEILAILLAYILKRTHARIEQASPPEIQSQTPKPRPKGVHSMEVIS